MLKNAAGRANLRTQIYDEVRMFFGIDEELIRILELKPKSNIEDFHPANITLLPFFVENKGQEKFTC